jgi:hypothetical protein
VFIHTNHRQTVGAIVAEYALKRNSKHADEFDVRIIHTDDHPFLRAREGQRYKRDGATRVWEMEDLQSFTPLRFMPPELMGYQGRAMVIDPDIFAVADVWDLLSRDMNGAAILCRKRSGPKGWYGCYASSVMLLDCAKLTHWNCERDFNAMFEGKRDYMNWISLKLEPKGSIGPYEPEWNDLDKLTPQTKMLHNTKRITQPWKTGLPIDFMPPDAFGPFPIYTWFMALQKKIFGKRGFFKTYTQHPDPNQEKLFFDLLRECFEKGLVTEDLLREEMERNHVRHDVLDLIAEPRLAAA